MGRAIAGDCQALASLYWALVFVHAEQERRGAAPMGVQAMMPLFSPPLCTHASRQSKEQGPALSGPSKLALWEELKLAAFTRAVGALWLLPLLDLFVRVQLNILGRHLYLESALDSRWERVGPGGSCGSGGRAGGWEWGLKGGWEAQWLGRVRAGRPGWAGPCWFASGVRNHTCTSACRPWSVTCCWVLLLPAGGSGWAPRLPLCSCRASQQPRRSSSSPTQSTWRAMAPPPC